ncbi:MAG TPA: permease [Candidatus Thermoplasmatota archaeon]|nr:permease [Candidatus Thermoplasmatota archaeon]HUU87811.1 permease [Candidatus Glassbacteria bacterium]
MSPIDIIIAGFEMLMEYLSAHVLTCLIPAFFIAGAIAVFVSKQSVMKYFGANTKKYISYPVAALSGTILAVCSCTVLPLFTSIHKRGAGIGPASAFLFSGPAINILAIVLTAQVLGYDIGLARAIAAIVMAVVIGLLMAFIFRKEEFEKKKENNDMFAGQQGEEKSSRPIWISLLFLVLLVLILVIGAASSEYIPWVPKLAIVYMLTLVVSGILIFYYTRDEVKNWGMETWGLTKKIFPILLVGVFIVGIIGGVAAYFLPGTDPANALGVAVAPYIGGNDIFSCFLASVIGAILYMPTLLEVAIVGNLFGYSAGIMGGGPALALLLAGPSLSLPNMVVITKVMGVKKALVYFALVIIIATLVGFMYGIIAG